MTEGLNRRMMITAALAAGAAAAIPESAEANEESLKKWMDAGGNRKGYFLVRAELGGVDPVTVSQAERDAAIARVQAKNKKKK